MDFKQKIKKYKENKLKLENNIVHIIDTKILPKRLSTSLILLLLGGFLYYRFINDKNIGGVWALIFTAVVYFSLGIGLYGLFTWLVVKLFQLLAYMYRLIFKGQVQITVNKSKISSKLVYK